MTETVNWSINVNIAQGPDITVASKLDLDAYDKIAVVIANGETKEVEVQPGDTDEVKLLLITSDVYGDALTYELGGDTVKLDEAQLLVGSGGVGLLPAAPKMLKFSNGLGPDNDAKVQILVGRAALSDPP